MDREFASLAAALLVSTAQAQGTTAAPQTQSMGATQATDKAAGYRSAFSDYRLFSQPVATKEWRRANDELREAGGHAGLMKGEPAQSKAHAPHGPKQPTPPAIHHK